MPHLLSISLKQGPVDGAPHPFSVPQIRTLPRLDVNVGVTCFVGENGSGKSTLLEGIAAAAELPNVGSNEVAMDDTLVPARQLGAALRLAWSPRSRQGFFLRAEDFFGYLKSMAREDARINRELAEWRAGIRVDSPRLTAPSAKHDDEQEAGRVVRAYDSRSHGESFMKIFADRIRPGGLYLLDEPEAPLSPKRQIVLLGLIADAAAAGAQFIVATHSPILLASPGARIYSFDSAPIAPVKYAELEHVNVTRDFLNHPQRGRAR